MDVSKTIHCGVQPSEASRGFYKGRLKRTTKITGLCIGRNSTVHNTDRLLKQRQINQNNAELQVQELHGARHNLTSADFNRPTDGSHYSSGIQGLGFTV